MRKVTKKPLDNYEQPQVTTILLRVEQGFANSSPNSQLDNMKETEGEWAVY